MKFKNVLMTFGLAAVLGLGVGAGLDANKEVKQAKAGNSTEETHLLYAAIATSTISEYENFNLRVNCNIGDGGTWRQTIMSITSDTSTYSGKTVFVGTYTEKYGGVDAMQIQIYDGDTWKVEKQPISSWDTTDRTGYLFNYDAGTWVTDYTPPTPIEYVNVTKLAVEFVSGVAQEPADWGLGSDSNVVKGSVYSVPGPVTKNLERFDGWFTNPACTSEYEESTINADLTLYAKYTRLSVDSYFYWTDKDSSTLTNIYFFGEYNEPVAWPGAALSTFKVDDVLYYNGEGKLYKIPCPSSGAFKAVLNSGGDGNKTYDLVVEPGKLLYTWDDNYSENGTEWWGGNFVDGSVADLVARIEETRIAVAASSGILQYSVCGIDPEQARDYYNEYYDMSADNKALVNASYTYTYKGSYDGEHTPSEDNIMFSEVILSLKKVAEDGGYSVKGSASYIFATNASSQYSSTGIIVAVAVATSALFVGGYFLLKKKRED